MNFFALNPQSPFLPLILLAVSLIGSNHCAIMCVPLVATYKSQKLTAYHLGRLTAYTGVGTVMYFTGSLAMQNQWLWLLLGLVFLGYFIKVSKDEFLTHSCCQKKNA